MDEATIRNINLIDVLVEDHPQVRAWIDTES